MTLPAGFIASADAALPLHVVEKSGFAAWRDAQPAPVQAWLDAHRFDAGTASAQSWADGDGRVAGAVIGVEDAHDPLAYAHAPRALPAGDWRVVSELDGGARRALQLGWGLGCYRFDRYKQHARPLPRLAATAFDAETFDLLAACVRVRDLVNTPTEHMGPDELEAAAHAIAQAHGATVETIAGDDLLAQNYPAIHAVGRASHRAPRLIELRWGKPGHPKVTLVGKGVCFDTGGLDLKPESAMLIMKKDMGGAATVLALAHMIMCAGLKVALRVLIPAVENSVAGDAFRPLDVYPSRKGLNVEIGNTDAEGRLVLADALALACEESPELLIDMGTLTGAARVALGPELPPYYTDDEPLAAEVARHATAENDPLWRLPLWRRYDQNIDSKIADVNNIAAGGMAGSIICALFLKRFVGGAKSWLHFDIYAWTPSARPGRPEGGECQAARALYALLTERYGR
jgi:leucyl aminopeptidase